MHDLHIYDRKNKVVPFIPGEEINVTDSPFGRLGVTVCYDLRFPELYQQLRFEHHAQVDAILLSAVNGLIQNIIVVFSSSV